MNAAAVELAPAMPPPMAVARVASVRKETYDTFTLTLEACNGQPLPAFAPGQFSMLYAFGVGELPISISGDPNEAGRLLYTVRSVGNATNALVSLKPGQSVGVRGPFGTGWPLEAARGRDVLIVAGGIGLAPLRPAIYELLRHRDDYVRVIVLYGARSPRDMLYRKQLAEWGRVPDTEVLTTVDYGGVNWRGHVGVVTTLFRNVRLHASATTAMICGPEIMMRYVIREFDRRGLPADQVYLSMERNMKCAIGSCGHCQMGPYFVCKDGPIFTYEQMRPWLEKYEL
ncbi:MAG: FAD/NAD(P)-binding protein [Bryobacteraceae bacterium]|jgi:NAD(P)H-flavin reductase